MGLKDYIRKRNFKRTPEPAGKVEKSKKRRFVLQEHHASRLHFDLRLEMAGVAKSWAVPKGPSLDPSVKRLAVETEDHPIKYLTWEGIIPEGYGAGRHMIWDKGDYELEGDEQNPLAQYHRGELKFFLHGRKVKGSFALVKMHFEGEKNQWLLIKHDDKYAEPCYELKLRLSTDEKAQSWRRMVHPDEPEPKKPARKAAKKPAKASAPAKKTAKKSAPAKSSARSTSSASPTKSTSSTRSTATKSSTKSTKTTRATKTKTAAKKRKT
jgi:bifunctional non-homologous end joining protein LigD